MENNWICGGCSDCIKWHKVRVCLGLISWCDLIIKPTHNVLTKTYNLSCKRLPLWALSYKWRATFLWFGFDSHFEDIVDLENDISLNIWSARDRGDCSNNCFRRYSVDQTKLMTVEWVRYRQLIGDLRVMVNSKAPNFQVASPLLKSKSSEHCR